MTYNKKWYKEYAIRNREKLNAYQREWSKKNRKKRNESTNKWKRNHIEIVKLMKRKSYLKNREKAISTVKRYYQINKERINLLRKPKAKIYRENNRERINAKIKEWNLKNKDRVSENRRKYQVKNRIHLNKKTNEYLKKKRLTDIAYRLSQNIGIDIWHALKDKKYNKRWQTLVGYSTEELIEHLESKFDINMNWGNYGKYWEIDHIKPRSLFKFSSHEDKEFKDCWSLKNLQPLEKRANRIKNNKYVYII